MWNLKYDTNELIYKTNRLTDIENRLVAAKRGRVVEGWIVSLGLADTNYYIEWINNKVLLYITGNYTQYHVINHNVKEYEKECIYMYNNHFAAQ